jgi:NAD(P)-dependent dehydrogenase (short-subunit alcohol dehydrogenase family)
MELASAKAVISGGASGLGFATAERIVAAGGHVVLLDINDDLARESAGKLGERAGYVPTDVASEASVRASLAEASEALGRNGPWPTEDFERVIRINLVGTFNVCKEAAAHMVHNAPNADGERGVIVNTASIAAFEGQIGQAAYSASKGGVVGMLLPLAREFAQFGIRVNTIAPGVFLTPMMASMSEKVQESLAKHIPFPQRLGRPEEYAATVAYIYETAMVNGETIRVDGAIRMQPK